MIDINSILLEGILVKDAVLHTEKEPHICTFTIASGRFPNDDQSLKKEFSFFDVETEGKLADECGAMGRKGGKVGVSGYLKQRRYTGHDGRLYSRIVIIAKRAEFGSGSNKEFVLSTTDQLTDKIEGE